MESKAPQESTTDNAPEYERMEEDAVSTVSTVSNDKGTSPPATPAPSEPEAYFDAIQTLQYSSTTSTANNSKNNSLIVPSMPNNPTKDALVTLYTFSRIATAIAFMTAAVNLISDEPGVHYMVAGFMLTASLCLEYVALDIGVISAALGISGSFSIIVAGTMSLHRRDMFVNTIGLTWVVASTLLAASHSYDTYQTYTCINPIVLSSKVAAILASLCFFVGGVMMSCVDDFGLEEELLEVYNMFTIGGVVYLIHAVNMFTGHRNVVEKIFADRQRGISGGAGGAGGTGGTNMHDGHNRKNDAALV